MSVTSIDAEQAKSMSMRWSGDTREIRRTLDLSESRTYDAALDSLNAYKLTGDFPVELEIVLKDLRVLDKVTFAIKPKSLLSDCRHVEFRPKNHVHKDRFDEIVRSINSRIGFVSVPPFWARLFGQLASGAS
jgi:hypothetical protein